MPDAGHRKGYRFAVSVATAVSMALANSDLKYCDEITRLVFDEMWTEAGGTATTAPDPDRMYEMFNHFAAGMATMLDAAHAALGNESLAEKLEALQTLAMIGENAGTAEDERKGEEGSGDSDA